jgi:hypothetical protein
VLLKHKRTIRRYRGFEELKHGRGIKSSDALKLAMTNSDEVYTLLAKPIPSLTNRPCLNQQR